MDSQELRERRLRLGLSQRELAERLDVTQETVSRWERGVLNIASPSMLRLALQSLEQAPQRPSGRAARVRHGRASSPAAPAAGYKPRSEGS